MAPERTGTLNLASGTFNFDPTSGSTTKVYVGYSITTASGGGFIFGKAAGVVNQGAGSSAISGNYLALGYDGGNGTWNLSNGASLSTGTLAADTYVIALGVNGNSSGSSTTGAVGTLNIAESSFTLGSATASATLQVGAVDPAAGAGTTGGNGTINEAVGSNVIIQNASTVDLGDAASARGVFNLNASTLSINDTSSFNLGTVATATGVLNQTGGTLNVSGAGTFLVGDHGIGTYNLTNGNANFGDGFTIGAHAGASGSVTVGGTSLLMANGPVQIGNTFGLNSAAGVLNINGGTAIFNGTVNLDTHGTLNLNGGIFAVAPGKFTANGTLNFGGGTLQFFNDGTTNYTFTINGSLTGNTSTIDVSSTSITSFTFTNALSGAGGIILNGNGATVFALSPAGNTFSGPLGINNGSVNIASANIANTSSLLVGSGGTMNLAVGTNLNPSFSYGGSVIGTGLLNVNFQAATGTLSLANGNGTTIVLGANTGGPAATTTLGTLQLFNGSFGTIAEGAGSPGNNVVIGDSTSSGSVTFANGTYTGTTTIFGKYALTTGALSSDVINLGLLNVSGNIGAGAGNFVSNSGVITAGSIAGSITNNTGTITSGLVSGNLVNSGVFKTTAGLNNTSVGGSVTNSGSLFTMAALPSAYDTTFPPASHTTFTIGGNFTQMSPGTISIRVQGGNADFFQVGGATVLNGSVLLARGSSTALGASSYVILNSNGGASGAPTPVSQSALFNFAAADPIVIGGNTVTINTYQQSIVQFVTPFGATPNQLAVAHSIDGTTFNMLKSYFNDIGPGPNAAPTMLSALNDLSPQDLQYSRDIAFENSTFLALRMDGVDADLRGGYQGLDTSALSVVPAAFNNSLGQSMAPLFASTFHDSAPNGVNYYPGGSSGPNEESTESIEDSGPAAAPNSRASARWSSSNQVISDTPNPYMAHQKTDVPGSPRLSEFVGGDVILADLNQNQSGGNAPPTKASYTAGDVIAGVSFRMTSNLAAGVLFDYNHTDAKTDNYGGKTDVDSYSPGLFATYFDHGFYANGLASFGYNNYSNTRDIGFLAKRPRVHRAASNTSGTSTSVTIFTRIRTGSGAPLLAQPTRTLMSIPLRKQALRELTSMSPAKAPTACAAASVATLFIKLWPAMSSSSPT